jgi:hypothetical protein
MLSQSFEKTSRSKYSTSMSSIPHGSSEPSYMLVSPLWSLELLCGILPSWPIFEAPPGSGLWSRWPPSSGSQWPVLRFPMAHPLVPNGSSSGSQWLVLRFQWPVLWSPMAHPLVPNGSSSVSNGPSSGSQWPILCGPSPGYLSRAPCGPRFGSRPAALPQDCLLSYLQLLLPNLPSYFYFHFYLHLPF